MVTQTPQPGDQTFLYIATNNKPPISNFEHWAQLVRSQMLASLDRRFKIRPIKRIVSTQFQQIEAVCGSDGAASTNP